MKITKIANNKKKISLSKNEWETIGEQAGWLKVAEKEEKADKDYDGDGEVETSEEEWKGSRDKAIKKNKQEEEETEASADEDLEKTAGEEMEGEDPCWDGYEMVGKKMKDGKEVPNCVPKSKKKKSKKKANFNHYRMVEAAKYKGKTVSLNKPFRTPGGPKKYSVYVKNDKGNVIKVNFGDPNMEIKRDNPEAKKSFRARHDCKNKKDKTKAGYWSCRSWSKNAPWV